MLRHTLAPGNSDVTSQVDLLSSIETKIAPRSTRISADLAERFGPFCVEIPDPDILVRRLKMREHPTSQFDYDQLVCGKVDYREQGREPGVDWALPERLVLIKLEDFAWQDEYRIAVGTRGTMNVENVGLTIQTGSAAPVFEPIPAPIFLRVRKLGELATLHRFAAAE